MPEETGVMEVEQVETGVETTQETVQQETGQKQTTEQEKDGSPFSPKTSREYSQWLKSLKDANPDDQNIAKFVRMAKDAYGRQFALNQIEAKGIDGVRERYATLDSVILNDPEKGELKGVEAIAAMQDRMQQVQDFDSRLAAGDPTILEQFGEDFNAGLAKLAPSILDRIKASDPEAYSNAVLPHFVEALAGSQLVSDYNAMVDVLNEKMPAWLPDDKKQAWLDDKAMRVSKLAAGMGSWLNAQADKVGKLPKPGQAATAGKPDKQAQREQEFNQREQEQHWKTNINPKLDQHGEGRFDELFKPYAKRLHLDPETTSALKIEFMKRVASTAAKDAAHMAQIKRYRAQRNPDAITVVNYAKVQFDKHAKTVMDALVNERYKPFLSGKPQQTIQTGQQPQRQVAASPGVTVVSVKPSMNEIDHKRTPLEWIHQRKYRLTNGKVVQVRA